MQGSIVSRPGQLGRIAGLAALIFLVASPARAQFDMAGEWAPIILEDWFHRVPGATLGDYTGMPINAAARQKAEAWDASILSQQERQAQAHPAQYSFRGPGPNLRIEKILEPVTDRLIGYRTSGTFGRADRTIWLDDRPHPSDNAQHTWNGFSTGKWVDNTLVVTTTHMKMGVIQRNGTPASPYAKMTEYWFRHGEMMTMMSFVEDPIYLDEPMVRSQTWLWNPPQTVGPAGVFESIEEVDLPLGWVPHWELGTRHPDLANELGVPIEVIQGGKETLYPEFRLKIQQMIKDAAARGARPGSR
jgi:hypothetical protein